MPRAFDPGLNGGGIPITSSPLNRMGTSVTTDFDLAKFLEDIINQLPQMIGDILFPAIENLTGIDLSALLPLLNLLHFDFSSPAAFIESLIAAVLALPGALIQLLIGLIDQLVNLPETLTQLLSGLIGLLLSLTTILRDLLIGLVEQLTALTGIDLSVFLPLLDLLNIDLSSPEALLFSLMTAVMSIPSIVADIMTGIVEQIADLTGVDLTVFLPLLDLLNIDFTSPATFLGSLTTSIMSIPEVFTDLVGGIIDLLVNLPETLTLLITSFVALLATLPETILNLLTPLIGSLTDMTGVDLSIFLPLLDLLNFDFTSPETFVSSLVTSIMSIPAVIEDLLGGLITTLNLNPDAITDMLTGLIDQLVTLPAMLGDLLSGLISLLVDTPDILLSLTTSLIDLLVHTPDILTSLLSSLISLIADLPTLLINLAESLVSSGAGLLGANSPLNAFNIFGTLGSSLFGAVPIGSLVNVISNIIPLGGLFQPGSIASGGGWLVDMLTDLGSGPGSAKITANGTRQGLLGVVTSVTPGQKLDLSAKTKWSGLTSVGGSSPITFGLTGILGGVPVLSSTIGAVSAPGASGTQTLSGQYTVPAGIDSIRLRLGVTPAATAGTVWFSGITGTNPGEIQQDWVTNLVPQFQGILDMLGLGALDDLLGPDVTAFWTNIVNTLINPLNMLTELVDFTGLLSSFGGVSSTLSVALGQVTNAWTNLLKLFNVATLGILTGAPGSFNPSTILDGWITALINPLNRLGQLATATSGTNVIGQLLNTQAPPNLQRTMNEIWGVFGGVTTPNFITTPKSPSDVNSIGRDFFEILAQAGFNIVNLNNNQTENTQTKQILAGQIITPINSFINSIKAWFDLNFP